MSRSRKTWINSLSNFSRLISEAAAPEAFPLLADSAVKDIGADASAVFHITENAELSLAASMNLKEEVCRIPLEAGLIGPDLSQNLLKACGTEFSQAQTFPIMSGTDLFGALVIFYKKPQKLDQEYVALVEAFVQMAAIAASKSNQYIKLGRAHTELQESYDVLARTEKLRALGQMSASISHDVRNLLAPLSMQAGILKQVAGGNEFVLKIAEELEKSVQRGVDTTERMRLFSRQSPEESSVYAQEIVNLDTLIREAAELCKPRLHSRVEVKLYLANPPPVQINASDFVAAIVNLIFNAVDAMGDAGGVLTLASGTENGSAWIKITDTGPGIPDEVRKRIFEPFFTTKGKEGTGLGLSMVYAFVQRHGGDIQLETAPGKGTAFILSFPCGRPDMRKTDVQEQISPDVQKLTVAARAVGASLKPRSGERGKVFVIDDDPDIRAGIRELLEVHGWAVEMFSSGETFLKTDHADRKGCVLVDALIPGMMGGLELLQLLKKSAHRLPAIMVTGSGDISTAVNAMKAGALDFIEKPVKGEELLASLERAFEVTKSASGLITLREAAAARAATLTPRQRQVLDLVLAGHPNKNIAADLGISQRTVETHRADIMEKMGAKSIPALIRLSIAAA